METIMDDTYFESIERHCQITNNYHYTNIIPVRRILRLRHIQGREVEKVGVSQIPSDTMERMVRGANEKYKKMTEKIIQQIQTSKRKGKVKYQTLGWKHAKEIKSWCDKNNVICAIVTDPIVTRNKLSSVNIWHTVDGELYNDGTRDYGHQHMDFHHKKQNVVYVEVKL